MASCATLRRFTQTRSIGGSAETEVIELTVRPQRPFSPSVVTMLTPLTALTLADILYEAGLPPQMFQVVTGRPEDIGDEMVTNPDIDIISFTGGVPVGHSLLGKLDLLLLCSDGNLHHHHSLVVRRA